MKDNDAPKVYNIPDNFIDESRIFRGMFKTRYFIEGLILALIFALPTFLIKIDDLNMRVTLTTAFAAIPFLIGNNGINGDTVSTTIKNGYNWLKNRKVMLYNYGTHALKTTPLTAMMEQTLPGDRILDIVDNIKRQREEQANKVKYIEGETFEFEEDLELSGLYLDLNTDKDTDKDVLSDEPLSKEDSNHIDTDNQSETANNTEDNLTPTKPDKKKKQKEKKAKNIHDNQAESSQIDDVILKGNGSNPSEGGLF